MSFAKKYRFAAPLLILLLGIGALFLRPLKIESDFWTLLPETARDDVAERETRRALSEYSARLVHILFASENESAAVAAAKTFSASVPAEGFRRAGAFSFSEKNLDALREFFRPYRFQLLASEQRELLRSRDFQTLQENALAEIYSPMGARLFSLREDPFGFATKFFLENPLLRSPFYVRDGVPCARHATGTRTVACLSFEIEGTEKLSALREKMQTLYAIREKTRATAPEAGNTEILFAGVPVHTDFSASQSLREINALAGVSLALLCAIFFAVFRSLKPFFITAGTLLCACVVAAGTTNAVFGEMHVLVLVFGCSLIGIAVDYVLHVLVAGELTPSLKKSLAMSAGTTSLAFCVFFFSGIAIFSQIALFCIVGIAFVLVCTLSALAGVPAFRNRKIAPGAATFSEKISAGAKKIAGATRRAPFAVPAVFAVAGIFALFSENFSDDIRHFYAPEETLAKAEKLFAEISGQNASAPTLLLCGNDEEDVLSRQRALSLALNAPHRCISQLVPPAGEQRENAREVAALFSALGEDFPVKPTARATADFPAPEIFSALTPTRLATRTDLFPADSTRLLFWRSGDLFFAPIFVRGNIQDTAALLALCEKYGAKRLDTLGAISARLLACTERTAALLGVAVCVFALIFSLRYGIRCAAWMLAPTLCAFSVVICALAATGTPVSLFHMLAFFLTLGFGVDYVIFGAENGGNGRSRLSVLLSCATTLIAFGLLAWTEFPATREIGLAVALGIFSDFIFAEIFSSKINALRSGASANSRRGETARAGKAPRA